MAHPGVVHLQVTVNNSKKLENFMTMVREWIDCENWIEMMEKIRKVNHILQLILNCDHHKNFELYISLRSELSSIPYSMTGVSSHVVVCRQREIGA